MNAIEEFTADCGHEPDTFAAELTEAVFPVALHYGVAKNWLDLELDLWHVLSETVERWGQASPNGLLTKLTDAAYYTARRHGTPGSVPQSQVGLYQAFRSAMWARVRDCQGVPA